ncbi:MAG: FG-GAP-like repeat-containing protein [Anaerolineales bacterium]
MKPIYSLRTLSLLLTLLFVATPASGQVSTTPASPLAPQLKWQNAGCYSSWCETGWYSSPAVADLDQDGKPEVIGSAYSIWVLDGESGAVKWRVASGHDRSQPEADSVGRTWPGIGVADLQGDGDLEIITAHSAGYVSVYDHNGYFEPGWPKRPTQRELRGLSLYDIDQDGSLEIVVTGAVGAKTNIWVFEPDGSLRSGWPQLSDDSGYAYGVFNDNAALGDLDGDGYGEIVVPSDVHYVCAYEASGQQIPANPMYGDKGWGQVGVWESLDIELRGWGTCNSNDSRAERYRPNFAPTPALVADVNADGANEAVVIGNVYDCIDGYPSRYNGVFIFNADRSRFHASGFDWRSVPWDTGAPLSEDYAVIENNQPNPAVADLDGDGNLEIIYSSYDGRVHAFWLDKTEHGNWPFEVTTSSDSMLYFASEPVVADLDNNGLAEVLFTSWAQKGSDKTGRLYIVDHMGNLLSQTSLPAAWDGSSWNGALPAPTLANIDGDPSLELVVNTAHTGLVAYDLPGTTQARILWGTGRGNFQRSGSILQGSLQGSSKSVDRLLASPGDSLHYNITLRNPGPDLESVVMTDTLPFQVSYTGGLTASSGSVQQTGGMITWHGTVSAGVPVVIQFDAAIDAGITSPQAIVNRAEISDGLGEILQRQAVTFVGGYLLHLPQVDYNAAP